MATSTRARGYAAAVFLSLTASSAAFAAGSAMFDPGASDSYVIDADVVRVSPRYGWREVSEPVRECVDVAAPYESRRRAGYPHGSHGFGYPHDFHDDYAYRRHRHGRHRTGGDEAAAGLVGGLIGGLIGNQFGGGNGRTALTVAGALIGASVASDHVRRSRTYAVPERHYAPATVRRCTDGYRTRQVRGPDGYDVSYRYQGRTFTKWMAQHPGDTVPVRVAVTAAP